MNGNISSLIFLVFAVALILAGCQNEDNLSTSQNENNVEKAGPVAGQYIIVLDDSKMGDAIQSAGGMNQIAVDMMNSSGAGEAALLQVYSSVLRGFAAKLTPSQLEVMISDKRIKYIEQDKIMTLEPEPLAVQDEPSDKSQTIQVQTTPWGITAVDGGSTYTGSNQAWIVDTGVDQDHPDLNVNTSKSKTFVRYGKDKKTPDDLNGHGTHVAGTIAAKNNTIGVVGVAAGAKVVGVKVLNLNGSGYISDIIKGLDYVYDNAADGDVVNCSFGGGASSTLDNAISQFAGSGIFVSIAAGNSSANAGNYSPARVNGTGIYTVSAHNSSDVFASFSNYGNPPIDWCAPGVSVLSTYKNGGYATGSGTSMAAPHVAGILLATGGTITSRGSVSSDPDGSADPLASE